MRIGVIGHMGVVGGAVRHGLERIGHTVIGYDLRAPATKFNHVFDTEVMFLCLPTPARADGSCDTSRVVDKVIQLEKEAYPGLIVIKSTVTPGTTAELGHRHPTLRLAFCPEFLRERAAFVDFYENHDLCVIGVQGPGALADAALIRDAHGSLPKAFAVMSTTEAELAKYFSNVFNALRIVFANEFYEVARELGADYQVIKAAMVKRATIPDVYLDCNENTRGFGGVCLPKDTAAFAHLVEQLGLDMRLFRTIVDENKRFAVTVPDGMRP
jgi:UDPglucose 6-dehydrogenase